MDEIFAPFPAAERQIYPYFNGEREIKGDPLEIDARYLRELAGEDLAAIDKALESQDPHAVLRAVDRMMPAVRAAFKLQEFDEETGNGLTRGEVIALFNRFNEWKREKKAPTGPGPSTPPSTVDGPAPG